MLVILPSDAAPAQLDAIAKTAARHGFEAQASRGDEQTIVALGGRGDPAGVERDLAGLDGVEVVRLLTGRDYSRRRLQRRVVGWLATGLGLLTVFAIVAPILEYLVPPSARASGSEFSRAALVRALPEDGARTVHVKGRPVLVIRHGDHRYFALSAVCTHMEESRLEWDAGRAQIVCPNHGCVFDLFGNVAHGPASVPLERYTVERLADHGGGGERILIWPESP
jgi:nitrite reductase/ring-hydroxylating ferredoxin subunit